MKSTKSSPSRALALVFMAILIIGSGYLRDSIFKSMNALLRAWDLNQDYYLPRFLSFMENYEYETIVNLKWVLTVLFSILYLLFALIAIKLVFNNRNYLKITFYTYIGIIILSGIFISIGFIAKGSAEKMYEFARYLMGFAQSPIVLMVLIPAFKLSEKESNKTLNT
ncbi:hypothetical protein BH10BAC1_BH10BAC1_12520 [soil metagenome]